MSKLPIDKIESLYIEYEGEFNSYQVSDTQTEIIKKIDEILDVLDLGRQNKKTVSENGFNCWSIEELISAREKLSRYSEPLGEFISFHESRSDFAYVWRKGAYAEDWLPVKTKMQSEMPKVTNPEIENSLIQKYIGEQMYSLFHRRRADLLIRKLEAISRMLRTIDHRIRELERQMNLKHEPSITAE